MTVPSHCVSLKLGSDEKVLCLLVVNVVGSLGMQSLGNLYSLLQLL